MALKGDIVTLFEDKDKQKPILPRTSTNAVADANSGYGLDAILQEAAYVAIDGEDGGLTTTDADTLGGKPATAYMTKNDYASEENGVVKKAKNAETANTAEIANTAETAKNAEVAKNATVLDQKYNNELAGSTKKAGSLITVNLTEGTPLHVVSNIPLEGGDGTIEKPIPIQTINNLDLTACGKNYTVNFNQEIAAGSYDWNIGKLNNKWEVLTFDGSADENWLPSYSVAAQQIFSIITTQYISEAKSSWLPFTNDLKPGTVSTYNGIYTIPEQKSMQFSILASKIPEVKDVPTWKNYLSKHPIQVAFKTNDSKILSPIKILAVEGENNISTSIGITEVERQYNTQNIWISEDSESNAPIVPAYEKIVTVGQSGDYKTINQALEYLSQFAPIYQKSGSKYEIKILAGTTINEQIAVRQIDLSYITISAEDNQVMVNTTGWTFNGFDPNQTEQNLPFFGSENGGILPVINVHFKNKSSTDHSIGIFIGNGSKGIILPKKGFEGFTFGAVATQGGLLLADKSNFNYSHYYALHATQGGRIFADKADLQSAGRETISARTGSQINASEAVVNHAYIAIKAEEGSRVNANSLKGKDNPNTSSSHGYIESISGSIVNVNDISITSVEAKTTIFKVANGGIMIISNRTVPTIESVTETSQALNTLTANGIIFG